MLSQLSGSMAAPFATVAPQKAARSSKAAAAAAADDPTAFLSAGAAIPSEIKSETWPYPLKLPTFPLDFDLLHNPQLSIFHDACGHPLVRFYWPASTASTDRPSSEKRASAHSKTRARGVVVLVHDEGTHTVFDWLKNWPMTGTERDAAVGAEKEFAGVPSSRHRTAEPLATPPLIDIGLVCFDGNTTAGQTAGEVPSLSARTGDIPFTERTAATKESDTLVTGGKGDVKTAAVTAAAAATEGLVSLLPSPPLFRDLPQKPLHAARTACYEGSWVQMFNAAGFDVHAVDLLQHGLSALVERQQQRQRRRRRRQEKKGREEGDGVEEVSSLEEDGNAGPFPFDLLAEDLCCLLEDISRFSTLPIFLLGQGIGATAATRAAELLAKRGKLGKPHSLRSTSSDTTAQGPADMTGPQEYVSFGSLEGGYGGSSGASPSVAGIRHIGKETLLPVRHIAVRARPIPLAGLVLLSPVLQLRDSVALEQIGRGAPARKRHTGQRLQQKEGEDVRERRQSAETHTSEQDSSTSAEEDDGEKGRDTHSREQRCSPWNFISWALRGCPGAARSTTGPPQYGVRLRHRRALRQQVLLPPLELEEDLELEREKKFDALYDKLYFRDRLTVKTLLPYAQLVELRKGVSHTLNESRWLLIPIERDSQDLVTSATWLEQYERWKQTIARQVKEGILGRLVPGDPLQAQQLPVFNEDDPVAAVEPSVDLAPWLELDAPAASTGGVSGSAAAGRGGAAGGRQTGSASHLQREEEDDVQQEEDATDAEILRRRQLKRMQMAFYLKVLIVQGMSAPQEVGYEMCGCRENAKALPEGREVDCLAEAADAQGIVAFYRSLGGKGSTARRILVQHGQLPPTVLKRRKGKKRGWLAESCGRGRDADDRAAATALAAAAEAEAAQTDKLILLDVGSEEERMELESRAEEDEESTATDIEDEEDEHLSWGAGPEYLAGEQEVGSFDGSSTAAFTASDQGLASPYAPPLDATTVGASRLMPSAKGHEEDFSKIADTWGDSDMPSNAAIEARYAALQEERKRLDENLSLLGADVQTSTGSPAGPALPEDRKLGLPMRRSSSVYKSALQRDLVRYGTHVRLPDRAVPVGETTIKTEVMCKNLLWGACGGPYPTGTQGGWATIAAAEGKVAGTPRFERVNWIKVFPASWATCTGGPLVLPLACVQAPCEMTARVQVVEEVSAPVHVVEKIIMHEATDALKATIAEIKAREQQLKGGGEAQQEGKEETKSVEAPVEPAPAQEKGIGRLKKTSSRAARSWRRIAGIVVDDRGRQVPLVEVERLRLRYPREYVNLFLYGATTEAAAAQAGTAETEGMRHRQVKLWLLPEVRHAALCQADEGNKIGKVILDRWLLPALADLQRSEALWQGSQMRSQLRKQLSNPSALAPRSS